MPSNGFGIIPTSIGLPLVFVSYSASRLNIGPLGAEGASNSQLSHLACQLHSSVRDGVRINFSLARHGGLHQAKMEVIRRDLCPRYQVLPQRTIHKRLWPWERVEPHRPHRLTP